MPLSDEQQQLEHELRVKEMETNIKQMEANMTQMEKNILKMQKDMNYETRKFVLQIIATIAVSVGAGVALTNWVHSLTSTATAPAASAPRPG